MTVRILFAVLLFAANPPIKPDPKDHQANAQAEGRIEPPVTVVINLSSASQEDHRKDKAPQWDASVWANWALVAVGVLTFWAIWKQVKETADATQAMRESLPHQQRTADATARNIELFISKERARLRVEMKPLALPQKPDPAYTVDFTVSIYGPSDAFITESLCVAYIFPEQVIDNPDLGDRIMFPIYSLPAVIPAKNPPLDCYSFLPSSNDADDLLITEARNGRMLVGVRGFIKYRDTFERERETTFRYVWRYAEKMYGLGPDYGAWVKNGCPEENRET